MNPGKRYRWVGYILSLAILLLGFSTPFQSLASFPSHYRMFNGQEARLSLSVPVSAQVSVENPDVLHINGLFRYFSQVSLKDPIRVASAGTGHTDMQLKLFGKIPIRTVHVQVIPELKVIPGGQTIGVKLKSAGILVVGHHQVTASGNRKVSPGEEARLQLGDMIISINGVPIKEVEKVGAFTEEAGKSGKPLELGVMRRGEKLTVKLMPAYDILDRSYRLGLYIRDSAAGVGTLTFYAPSRNTYGALGHVITDMDTQMPIAVGGGEIVHSNVTSIAKSQNGDPGEKIAHFFREGKTLGNIEKNTSFGIFGKMNASPDHGVAESAIPVAFAHEVKPGPAQIYTVVSGQKVEKFDIEITHVSRQDFPATKGLVLKITDKRLLERTGGIVQGMSGSPIIQNGKMVGAVTHVFVNNPTNGYGCFIEWMLRDAGLLDDRSAQEEGKQAS
ncbi:SpoIVB peptidase [Gorillibacterium timonense]|uniref:SpoIVB peptidase n=1 Tax=Gorillibacterium timonense TaxID=1689269 RepID=UPI00071C7B0B|nr:SpoIVB peptidase [Gorillibacterium timonense]